MYKMLLAIILTTACGVKGRPLPPLLTEKSIKEKELEAKKKQLNSTKEKSVQNDPTNSL